MKWRGRIKDRDKEVVTEFGFELDAAVRDILQTDAALDDDERARLRRSERCCGEHDLVIDAFAELPAMPSGKRHAHAVAERDECLPDFRLKEDDDGDAYVDETAAQDKLKRR